MVDITIPLPDEQVLQITEAAAEVGMAPEEMPYETLEQLLAGITPENFHEVVDFGPPVGREIW